MIDVLIVDTKSDLNVYFTANEAPPSCCKGTNRDTDQDSSSCAPPELASSLETGDGVLVYGSGITDFNEWAGKCTSVRILAWWLTNSL